MASLAAADEAYDNPVDGRTYVAPWQTYEPNERQSKEGQKVYLEQVILLSPQEEFGRYSSVKALADLTREAEAHGKRVLGQAKGPANILIQFECTDEKQDVSLAYQGPLKEEELQGLYDALRSMSRLQMKPGTLKFQVQLNVAP